MQKLFLLGLCVAITGMSASVVSAAPSCVAGFSTVASSSWLLKCSRTVPIAQKGVALTQAGNAVCKTDRYWNFGPKVESSTNPRRAMVTVIYTCGHVEG